MRSRADHEAMIWYVAGGAEYVARTDGAPGQTAALIEEVRDAARRGRAAPAWLRELAQRLEQELERPQHPRMRMQLELLLEHARGTLQVERTARELEQLQAVAEAAARIAEGQCAPTERADFRLGTPMCIAARIRERAVRQALASEDDA